MILWREDDAILPTNPYPELFAEGIASPVTIKTMAAAGQLIDLDQPVNAAAAVVRFLHEQRALQPA